ncbi:MAG: glycosyltransferase family 4 protein [Bacteroidota bacterium]
MQNQKQPRILMLGWEFPPLMSGGLAIATHGLVKALSNMVQITLVVPKKAEDPQLPGVTVIGLNQLAELDLPSQQWNQILQRPCTENWDHVSAYPNSSAGTAVVHPTKSTAQAVVRNIEVLQEKNMYGDNLMQKISIYTELVAEIAQYLDFDLIHAHDWLTFSAGKVLKNRFRKPLVLHVHALETDRSGQSARNSIYSIEREGMMAADAIVPVSAYTKQRITEHYKVSSHKIHPVHNGINPKLIKRWNSLIPEKIVAFVGRITFQKGPQFLLETAEKVIDHYQNVRFVIAGQGDQLETLMDQIADRELSKYFIFAGFLSREEVDALLATSNVYFMPSVSEPFGLSALEAVQAGTPCVLSKQSGVAELLTASLKANFWETDLFSYHILSLLKNDPKAQKMARQAKEQLKTINWDEAAVKVASIYHPFLHPQT